MQRRKLSKLANDKSWLSKSLFCHYPDFNPYTDFRRTSLNDQERYLSCEEEEADEEERPTFALQGPSGRLSFMPRSPPERLASENIVPWENGPAKVTDQVEHQVQVSYRQIYEDWTLIARLLDRRRPRSRHALTATVSSTDEELLERPQRPQTETTILSPSFGGARDFSDEAEPPSTLKRKPPALFPTTPLRSLQDDTTQDPEETDGGEDPLLSEPDQVRITLKNRVSLAAKWYSIFNEAVFQNQLPTDIPIEWNTRLRNTSGVTRYTQFTGGKELTSHEGEQVKVKQIKCVQLSTKWLTTENRLASTLLHECCHIAQQIIDSRTDDRPHGPVFQKWAKLATCRFPEFPVGTRHTYNMDAPHHEWKCDACDHVYQRWSKSLDPTRHGCGIGSCRGHLVYLGKISRDRKKRPAPSKPKKKAWPAFVKEHYASVKEKFGEDKQSTWKRIHDMWLQAHTV